MPRATKTAVESVAIPVFGLFLFAMAVVIHGREMLVIDRLFAPTAAFLLDGVPALGLAYGGYRLAESDLSADARQRATVWSFLGALLFVAVIGATFLIRWLEGRVISEPVLPLLIAAEAGAIAGLVAGYYNARALTDAKRASETSNALRFVNFVIRHDLRNDLSLIRSTAELLAMEEDGTASDGDEAERIIRKSDEAVERIETSQAIVEAVTGEFGDETVDLAALASQAVERLEQSTSVSVGTDVPAEAPVRANLGLRSVLDNLLENAVEHTDSDEPNVTCTVARESESVTLTVADDGPGLPSDARKVLVGEGDSTESEGGLSLVRTLIEAYDGTIDVEANEPRGTRITVRLSRAGADEV